MKGNRIATAFGLAMTWDMKMGLMPIEMIQRFPVNVIARRAMQ